MGFLKQIERKWQKKWEEARIFEADPDLNRRKCFVTFPFPYMNGPIHVGHGFTATRIDAYARFKRMQGYNVLFPWAWQWTGETVAGASERIKLGDKDFIHALKEVDGVKEEDLKKFVDPVFMASYYTEESRKVVKRMGFSVDWRREFYTTAQHPTFNKFIEWQYKRLREKGYVVKGTHPVVWCPRCESATGDADRHEGEGVSHEEYTLIKFKFGDSYLPAATFRPETIYGVTNLWIHPVDSYVKVQVDGEQWIVSKTTPNKLKEQRRNIKVLHKFKGKELVGKHCTNPLDGQELLILPGWFVNSTQATGVVYSVPAHAPYDWLALRALQKNPQSLSEFGIDPITVQGIKPVSLIKVDGFGEYPAIEIVEKLGVRDQSDPKADEATKILYKKEFHSGILKHICREYAGRMVYEVKDQLVQDLRQKDIADFMYDLPQPVICRCLTPCIVKILENQWFLKYSDKAWKQRTKEALGRISFYPAATIQWFIDVIDWLRDWACVRKTGLGTPLPWSPSWVVETLSDSTIYMAFYTIQKHIREQKLKAEQLIPEVFDFVFLGEGNVENVTEKSHISQEVLKSMRNEFLYWYPVDLRNSAKELVSNHLTFYIFHHVALFPPEHWPKVISVNGMLMIEGNKMSKSKGNFVTLENAIKEHGADATRCALLLGAEGMDDPDWRDDNVREIKNKLESFYRLAEKIIQTKKEEKMEHVEKWLISTLQHRVKNITESLDKMKTRTALENALFEIWNDIRWYTRRRGKVSARILMDALGIWVKLLAPFAPFICEEIGSKIGKEDFISLVSWPKYEAKKVNLQVEQIESLIKSVLDDSFKIIHVTKIRPKKICYYVAAPWKWKVYLKTVEKSMTAQIVLRDLMKELMANPKLKAISKKVAKFVSENMEEISRMPTVKKQIQLENGMLNEHETLDEAKDFFQRELCAEVYVYLENDPEKYDPTKKAHLAKPYRPAIYIE